MVRLKMQIRKINGGWVLRVPVRGVYVDYGMPSFHRAIECAHIAASWR